MTKELGTRVLGVMQPYLFPYLGYFQYIGACTHFIFYDDVQFIMRGWINRNNILLNNKPHMLTVPLQKASPNKLIKDTLISEVSWKEKFLATLRQAYRSAPEKLSVIEMVERVINKDHDSIAGLAHDSIVSVCEYLNMDTEFIHTSTIFKNAAMNRNDRLADLCEKMNAGVCVVPLGGSELYPKEEFAEMNIEMKYLKPVLTEYVQRSSTEFVSSLSILDVLMWNDRDAVLKMTQAGILR